MSEQLSPDELIGDWRDYLRSHESAPASDADELEDRLRNVMAALSRAGLTPDEAFLVAVRRLGAVDEATRRFLQAPADQSSRKGSPVRPGAGKAVLVRRADLFAVIGLAAGAGLSVKLPALFGIPMSDANEAFYLRNAALFALPWVFAYFGWQRGLTRRCWIAAGMGFAAVALVLNGYPLDTSGQTFVLAVLHSLMVCWALVAVAHTGGMWRSAGRRMHFVRFSGELFIQYVLIALGGGVLTALSLFAFQAIGIDAELLAQQWLLPCGAAGAVVVAAWLVDAKQSVVGNMAPVLTRVFTPLFAAMLVAFLVTMLTTGRTVGADREVLIGFDLLLVVVLGLVLFAVSARNPQGGPSLFDGLQLTLVVAALIVDLLALAAISSRIGEFGFSANKLAALGENLILLANLSGTAWLLAGFLRGNRPFRDLERWQTAFLPVYSGWALVVVAAFPPFFAFG